MSLSSDSNINNFYGFFTNIQVSCHYFRFLNSFFPSTSVMYSKARAFYRNSRQPKDFKSSGCPEKFVWALKFNSFLTDRIKNYLAQQTYQGR